MRRAGRVPAATYAYLVRPCYEPMHGTVPQCKTSKIPRPPSTSVLEERGRRRRIGTMVLTTAGDLNLRYRTQLYDVSSS